MRASLQLRPDAFTRLCGLLLAALMTACGGGSDDEADDTAAPPSTPGPATAAFQLLPPRLALTTGSDGQLLAVGAPAAFAWTTSDPAVASVDADGKVSAVGAGSAVITAGTGTSVAATTVQVFAPGAASASGLIAAARAQNTITADRP